MPDHNGEHVVEECATVQRTLQSPALLSHIHNALASRDKRIGPRQPVSKEQGGPFDVEHDHPLGLPRQQLQRSADAFVARGTLW
jgi:hypothetical protein